MCRFKLVNDNLNVIFIYTYFITKEGYTRIAMNCVMAVEGTN